MNWSKFVVRKVIQMKKMRSTLLVKNMGDVELQMLELVGADGGFSPLSSWTVLRLYRRVLEVRDARC